MQGLMLADSQYFTGTCRTHLIHIPLNPLGCCSSNHWLLTQRLLFRYAVFLLAAECVVKLNIIQLSL